MLFDAFWWSSGPPSGRNVLTSLVTEWSRAYPEDELTIARRSGEHPGPADHPVPGGVREVRSRVPQHAVSTIVELSGKAEHDVVISQNFTPWRSAGVRAVFLHDALFQEHPEWFTSTERRYLSLVPRLARRADIVFTSSRSERDRIASFNPRLAAKTYAVGLGLAEDFRVAESARPERPLEPQSYLLTVGRLNVRKNLEFLVSALGDEGVISAEFPLVVVGESDGMAGASTVFDRAVESGSVIRLGFTPTAELKWLYSHCAAFVFPSLDEGFGLPVLEAAATGAPMALSAIPSFLEFGAVGQFFDPRDAASIAGAVRAAIGTGPRGAGPRGAGPRGAGASDRRRDDVVELPLDDYDWTHVVRGMRERIVETIVSRRGSNAATTRG